MCIDTDDEIDADEGEPETEERDSPPQKGAIRTQAEVARIMTENGHPMGGDNVWDIETRAMKKLNVAMDALARDPELQELLYELGRR